MLPKKLKANTGISKYSNACIDSLMIKKNDNKTVIIRAEDELLTLIFIQSTFMQTFINS